MDILVFSPYIDLCKQAKGENVRDLLRWRILMFLVHNTLENAKY